MNQAAEFARLEAINLPVGSTLPNTICPVCGGGLSRRPTFAITRLSDKIAYCCYRASCEVRGYVDDGGRIIPTGAANPAKPLKPYTGKLVRLSGTDINYFWKRFEIPADVSDSKIRVGIHNCYVLPIFNNVYRIVGHVLRQPAWKGNPGPVRHNPEWTGAKSMTYMKEAAEPISFYRGGDNDDWVIVEDQISAIKLSAYGCNSVALLGTHLNMPKAREIQRVAKRITIALDADATNKAFKMAKDYGLAFEKVKVVLMEQDVKDTPANEFYELFGG
jgi:hypothetical protein